MRKYFIVIGFQRKGPYSIEELYKNNVQKDTLIYCFEFSEPIQAGEIPELKSLFDGSFEKEELESNEKQTAENTLSEENIKHIIEQAETNIRLAEEQTEPKIKEDISLAEEQTEPKIKEDIRLAEEQTEPKIEEDIRLTEEQTSPKIEEAISLTEEQTSPKIEENIRMTEEQTSPKIEEDIRLTEEQNESKIEDRTLNIEKGVQKPGLINEQHKDDTSKTKPTKPKKYLLLSILVTILCCFPIGILGIFLSIQVDKKYAKGNYAGAKKTSKELFSFLIIGVIFGAIIMLYILFTDFD